MITLKKRGFTLIELLVVIAIIALLSSIVYASVSSAREKAGVAKNKAQGRVAVQGVELARTTLLAGTSSTAPAFKNVSSTTPIGEKPKIAKAIFPSLEPLSEVEGTGSSGGNSTQLSDAVPKVPSSIPGAEEDDNYYYFGDGEKACMEFNFSGECDILLRCGNMNDTDASEPTDDYILAYKIELPQVVFPEQPNYEEVVGYDEDKQVMWRFNDNEVWTGLTWQEGFFPNTTSGNWQCF